MHFTANKTAIEQLQANEKLQLNYEHEPRKFENVAKKW